MDEDIRFGPVARAIYIALLWMTVLPGAVAADAAWAQRKRHASHHAEAARKVERKRRDEKLHKSRVRDPDLPKRW